ncbi:DUF4236 domain-containing protein [Actinomadura rugatobispora]|uniref:DUF4236 domain-containing protein n=1 Tax=Actinomadura rugatobispora TaxID=1994 RepID=A0ABW1A018_9ACTN|nr:hypothetical protein GCM10010200_010560 [Actinomadura rugatobispora]
MGWHYRKSIKIGPFRLNLSRSGVGHSVGARGARYTRGADGRKAVTLRVPGTGLSWRRTVGTRDSRRPGRARPSRRSRRPSWREILR